MTFVHGRHTKVTIDGDDISAFCKTTSYEGSVAMHDVTTYGPDTENTDYHAGLGTGKITHTGTYDDSATGPDALLVPLMEAKAKVPHVWQPTGTGAGKRQKSATVLVSSFNISDPVDDMITWTCELQICGPVDSTPQT